MSEETTLKDVNDKNEKCSYKKRAKASDYRDREYLHSWEMNKLLQASKKERNGQTWHCLLLLMYRHALRVSEAINLKWNDIDWQDGRVSIKRLKGSISGVHPLSADELRILKSLFKNKKSPYIFISSQNKPIVAVSVRKFIARLGVKIGLDFSIHPHMIRHTSAINFLTETKNLFLTKEFLGHREIDNTLIYLKLTPGMLENSGSWFR